MKSWRAFCRVGLTILKRVCRRFGIPRWPYNRQGRPVSCGWCGVAQLACNLVAHSNGCVPGASSHGRGMCPLQDEGGVADSSGMYSNGGQQPFGFGPTAGAGAGPQPFSQSFAPQLPGPQSNSGVYAHAPAAGAAGSQHNWQQQQQLQQALSSLFPPQQPQQPQPQQPQPQLRQPQLAALGQQDSNQLLQATIAALQAAPPGTLSSPAVQSLLSSLLGGALGGALAAGLGQSAAAPAPRPPPQWGSSLPTGQHAAPGGSAMQQLAALLQQPAAGRPGLAPAHPQPQPSNPLTTSALLSALGASASAQAQPARPAAARAGSGSLDVLAGAADIKLGRAAAAAVPTAAASTGAAPAKPSPAQQDTDGWGDSGGDSQGDDDEDLADFLEPGAQLPPRAAAPTLQPPRAVPPAPAAALPPAAAAAAAVASQGPTQQLPAAASSLVAQLQAQPEKADQLELQLLAALPDLRETAGLLRKAASQLQSHLLAQRLLKERTAQLGPKLPGSCQLLGVNAGGWRGTWLAHNLQNMGASAWHVWSSLNLWRGVRGAPCTVCERNLLATHSLPPGRQPSCVELAELCCTTLLTLLDGEGAATAAALQAAAQKQSNGGGTASGSGGKPPVGSPQERPPSSVAVKREEAALPSQGSPKRARLDSPAAV